LVHKIAPGKAVIQKELTEKEQTGRRNQGVVTWISMAIQVQESQLVLSKFTTISKTYRYHCRITLRTYIRSAGKTPTNLEKLEIAKRRERLQAKIDIVARKAAHFTAALDMDNIEDTSANESTDDEQDNDDLELPAPANGAGAVPIPEKDKIPLPSTIGFKRCQELGLDDLRDTELQLREGQANNALHGL
jgi:hypothetical protein